jgi:hypothetical protein
MFHIYIYIYISTVVPLNQLRKTSEAVSVTCRGDSYGCETSRRPFFLNNWLTDGGDVSLQTRPVAIYPQEDSWYPFLLVAEWIPGP